MSATWPNTLRVQLVKRLDSGLGFKVRKERAPPYMQVEKIVEGGSADESGLVEIGDRVISIQGVHVANMPFNQSLQVLHEARVGSSVILVLRAPQHITTHLETIFTQRGQALIVRVNNSLKQQTHLPELIDNGGYSSDNEDTISSENPAFDDNFRLQKPSSQDDLSSGGESGFETDTADYIRNKIDDTNLPAQHLRYLIDEGQNMEDTLHHKAIWATGCEDHHCKGSIMTVETPRPLGSIRDRDIVMKHAKDFFDQYFKDNKMTSQQQDQRWDAVSESIDNTGVYKHTAEELLFGAKTSWRNEPRCIGRMYWNKLKLYDCSDITTAKEMFDALCRHIEYSTNGGNIRATCTIFPCRTKERPDFRIWSSQLIRYAGYRQKDGTIIGDPATVDFTEVCQRLGWKGAGGRWDILPLIFEAPGCEPEVFDVPDEIVLRVQITHPKYASFADLGLQWYALPGVANMMLDCGGVEYPAVAFSGWYMSTEIGARDLCDVARYNVTKPVAQNIGLDTSSILSLWQDRAMVEVNVAVLHSYQKKGVSLLDHHSAGKLFVQHMRSEQKTRGGCPADWVWIVPPMSGNLCPVFHQEMLNYRLKPKFEYQEDPWKNHDVWLNKTTYGTMKKNFAFDRMSVAGSVRYKKAMESAPQGITATILYATETGTSENFATKLAEQFRKTFIVRVICMDVYDLKELSEENLVMLVTSTFGNGDPPENAEAFSKNIKAMNVFDNKSDHKVRFSVFALGSTSYPKFCGFGKFLNEQLETLGGERLHTCGEGDEMGDQEADFDDWRQALYKKACEIFDSHHAWQRPSITQMTFNSEANTAMNASTNAWSPWKYRLNPIAISSKEVTTSQSICEGLSILHKKTVFSSKLIERKQLQNKTSSNQTFLAKLDTSLHRRELKYEPSDHLAVFPANSDALVNAIIPRLKEMPEDPEHTVFAVEILADSTSHEVTSTKTWSEVGRLPPCTLHQAFSRYLDITTPPSRSFLKSVAQLASNQNERKRLFTLAEDKETHSKWCQSKCPTLLDLLEEFNSVQLSTSFLLTQLPVLRPRYYSISSSPLLSPQQVHLTVGVTKYTLKGSKDIKRYGVCSNWMNDMKLGEEIPCFIRAANHFHLPNDASLPVIMVGPGTGIAPYRSFWQHRRVLRQSRNRTNDTGPMILYFGCRNPKIDNIYENEIKEEEMNGTLTKVYRAFSRQPGKTKQYVQDQMWTNKGELYKLIVKQKGHFYLCGEVGMAEDVAYTLGRILKEQGLMTVDHAREYIEEMKATGRFHEDIFGVKVSTEGNRGRSRRQSCRMS